MDQLPIAFSVGMREGFSPSNLAQVRNRNREGKGPGGAGSLGQRTLWWEQLPLDKEAPEQG